MREIVFDTETTGREAEKGDRVVEIGGVEIINLAPTGRTFHVYINPQCDVPEEVVRVHGLTTQFLSDKKVFAEIVDGFLNFVGDARLVAHNSEFDRRFINAELRRVGREEFAQNRFVDTLPMARKKFPGAANSLDALAKRYQLDRVGFDLAARKGAGGHGALIDARMLAEIYLELNGGREQKLAFEVEAELARADSGSSIALAARAQRTTPLPRRLSNAEREAHAAFVTELGAEALWLRFGGKNLA